MNRLISEAINNRTTLSTNNLLIKKTPHNSEVINMHNMINTSSLLIFSIRTHSHSSYKSAPPLPEAYQAYETRQEKSLSQT